MSGTFKIRSMIGGVRAVSEEANGRLAAPLVLVSVFSSHACHSGGIYYTCAAMSGLISRGFLQ